MDVDMSGAVMPDLPPTVVTDGSPEAAELRALLRDSGMDPGRLARMTDALEAQAEAAAEPDPVPSYLLNTRHKVIPADLTIAGGGGGVAASFHNLPVVNVPRLVQRVSILFPRNTSVGVDSLSCTLLVLSAPVGDLASAAALDSASASSLYVEAGVTAGVTGGVRPGLTFQWDGGVYLPPSTTLTAVCTLGGEAGIGAPGVTVQWQELPGAGGA